MNLVLCLASQRTNVRKETIVTEICYRQNVCCRTINLLPNIAHHLALFAESSNVDLLTAREDKGKQRQESR